MTTPNVTSQENTPINKDETQPENPPTLIFMFDMSTWNTKLHPITKLELLDSIPDICSSFYYDNNLKSFILLIIKTKWNQLSLQTKTRFTQISLRIKKEIDGINSFNNSLQDYDLFDIYEKGLIEKDNDSSSESSQTPIQKLEDKSKTIPESLDKPESSESPVQNSNNKSESSEFPVQNKSEIVLEEKDDGEDEDLQINNINITDD